MIMETSNQQPATSNQQPATSNQHELVSPSNASLKKKEHSPSKKVSSKNSHHCNAISTSFGALTKSCPASHKNLVTLSSGNIPYSSTDISEHCLYQQSPKILEILLIDRTTSTPKTKKNIIWANDHYIELNSRTYAATAQIKPELITGNNHHLIMPRALKTRELQRERTKEKAEVFTPTWVVKKQNDAVEQSFLNDDLETYIKRKWLEMTCGEAPYMATRYDMENGKIIPLAERVGFVDRKLQRISAEIDDKAEWQHLAEQAYQSSYGFEWSGDSLLLARENLLYSYRDYYLAKWQQEPISSLFESIAEIISYNLFQMDGLKYIVPLSEKTEKIIEPQLTLFAEGEPAERWRVIPGKRVKVMNWETRKMEFFDKGIKK